MLVRLGVSYEDALQDGVILCKLMNIISPGSINKINPSGAGHFKICENLNKYERYFLFSSNSLKVTDADHF